MTSNTDRVPVLETSRLSLHRLALADAAFILELVNEPAWIRFIGDKGVRTLEDARQYIAKGPMASYERFGFGLFLVSLRASGVPIGISGLIQRDTLDDVDVGFALLPRFWGQGYASEAARACVELGRSTFGLARVVAITAPDNQSSIRVLESIGLEFERHVTFPGEAEELALYACSLASDADVEGDGRR